MLPEAAPDAVTVCRGKSRCKQLSAAATLSVFAFGSFQKVFIYLLPFPILLRSVKTADEASYGLRSYEPLYGRKSSTRTPLDLVPKLLKRERTVWKNKD